MLKFAPLGNAGTQPTPRTVQKTFLPCTLVVKISCGARGQDLRAFFLPAFRRKMLLSVRGEKSCGGLGAQSPQFDKRRHAVTFPLRRKAKINAFCEAKNLFKSVYAKKVQSSLVRDCIKVFD